VANVVEQRALSACVCHSVLVPPLSLGADW
jgi:hypothetical protein